MALTKQQILDLYAKHGKDTSLMSSVIQNSGMNLQDVVNTGAFTQEQANQYAADSGEYWLRNQAEANGVQVPDLPAAPQPSAQPATQQPTGYGADPYDMKQFQQPAQTMAAPTPTAPPPASRTGGPMPNNVMGGPGSMWPGAGQFGGDPFTRWQAQAMVGNVGDMLTRQALPAIDSNAVAAGGVGGSRQGVAQGLAIGDAAKGLSQGLASLYGNAYRADQQYDLGSGALDLNVYDTNQKWMHQGQRDQMDLMGNMLQWNQQGINNATNVQNTPMDYWKQFSGQANAFGGNGGTNSQQMPGSPVMGAVGGWQLGNKLFGG